MISNKSKYAFQALESLALSYGKGPVLISHIAQQERIPKKFLEAILLELKNHGILQSKKGKNGGYFLDRHPREITFGQVMRLFEGPLAPLPCASQTAYRKCDECVDEKICGVRMVMREVRDATAAILDGTTLADMLQKVEDARTEQNKLVMFHI